MDTDMQMQNMDEMTMRLGPVAFDFHHQLAGWLVFFHVLKDITQNPQGFSTLIPRSFIDSLYRVSINQLR